MQMYLQERSSAETEMHRTVCVERQELRMHMQDTENRVYDWFNLENGALRVSNYSALVYSLCSLKDDQLFRNY